MSSPSKKKGRLVNITRAIRAVTWDVHSWAIGTGYWTQNRESSTTDNTCFFARKQASLRNCQCWSELLPIRQWWTIFLSLLHCELSIDNVLMNYSSIGQLEYAVIFRLNRTQSKRLQFAGLWISSKHGVAQCRMRKHLRTVYPTFQLKTVKLQGNYIITFGIKRSERDEQNLWIRWTWINCIFFPMVNAGVGLNTVTQNLHPVAHKWSYPMNAMASNHVFFVFLPLRLTGSIIKHTSIGSCW